MVDIKSIGDESEAKLKILEDFCALKDIEISQCICIGDGDNDLPMFQKTGHGITFTGSQVAKYAEYTIDSLFELYNLF